VFESVLNHGGFCWGTELRARSGTIELTFLGTRGEIDVRSRRHYRHSALLIAHGDARIMIDCGTDWLRRISTIAPTAIVLTHAHPDHAGGLAVGAPCPVYATQQTLGLLADFAIPDPRRMPLKKSVTIGGVRFKAYPVQHSIRAPAVGYRVSQKAGSFFYLPDVARLPNASGALRGVDVYIGDGATIQRSMVRKKNTAWIGHTSITTQLDWCAQADVRRAIFTHCGSPIVRGDPRVLNALVHRLGRERGVDACLACDRDRLFFPDDSLPMTERTLGRA
jgi:phosphoribosyl 1,2-cyclic phosphodiesterase